MTWLKEPMDFESIGSFFEIAKEKASTIDRQVDGSQENEYKKTADAVNVSRGLWGPTRGSTCVWWVGMRG